MKTRSLEFLNMTFFAEQAEHMYECNDSFFNWFDLEFLSQPIQPDLNLKKIMPVRMVDFLIN